MAASTRGASNTKGSVCAACTQPLVYTGDEAIPGFALRRFVTRWPSSEVCNAPMSEVYEVGAPAVADIVYFRDVSTGACNPTGASGGYHHIGAPLPFDRFAIVGHPTL